MISAFTNTFKIPELRNRVIFTLLMLVVVRVGAAITCPGVNVAVLQYWFAHNAAKGRQRRSRRCSISSAAARWKIARSSRSA